MRAFVFTDTSLARHAGRFVWLGADYEDAKNARFRARYPVPGFPTFFVVDPVREAVTLQWVGGLSVAQLHALLDDVSSGRGTPPALIASLARADSLYAATAYAAAAEGYGAVLAAAPKDWRGASRVLESLLFALSESGGHDRVLALAREWGARLGPSPSGLNVAASGLGAAMELPDSLPASRATVEEFRARTLALVRDTSFATAADDRSGAYIELLDAAPDSVTRHSLALEWSAFLDGQAARARTPAERAVFDPHRLSAYLELGTPERAVPMLRRSEADFPRDYNPPARLAIAFRAMRQWPDALAASDRAMALAYGPRKLLLYDVRADVFAGLGDLAGQRRVLEEALAFAIALPESQRSAGREAALRKKLQALPAR